MKKLVFGILIIILSILALFIGCVGVINGSASTYTEEFTLSGFTGIDARNGFQLEIDRGETFSVEITVNTNIQKYLEVDVSGSKLTIKLESGRIYNKLTLEAKITMPSLVLLNLSGGSRATLDGFSSSGNFTANITGGSRVSGNLVAADINANLSGGSQLNLSGSASILLATITGGSQLNLEGFPIGNVGINLDGGSRATINISGILDANLSGGSQLYYIGNPTLGEINMSGGSSINKK
jgi:hypothetical protein